MARRVRIEGDPEVYEVLASTETTVLLVNPAAQERRRIRTLERQLREAERRLAQARGDPTTSSEASPP